MKSDFTLIFDDKIQKSYWAKLSFHWKSCSFHLISLLICTIDSDFRLFPTLKKMGLATWLFYGLKLIFPSTFNTSPIKKIKIQTWKKSGLMLGGTLKLLFSVQIKRLNVSFDMQYKLMLSLCIQRLVVGNVKWGKTYQKRAKMDFIPKVKTIIFVFYQLPRIVFVRVQGKKDEWSVISTQRSIHIWRQMFFGYLQYLP